MLVLVPSRLELEKLVPEAAQSESSWLWRDDDGLLPGTDGHGVLVTRCGVGIAVAGARTVATLLGHHPKHRHVVLAGLAGSLDEARAPVGSMIVGSSVALHGVGVGEGAEHLSSADAGGVVAEEFRSDMENARLSGTESPQRSEGLGLGLFVPPAFESSQGALLTVAAGAGTPAEALDRRRRHPHCLAEDMESFAVARGAALGGARTTVLRGVSNVAGDRDPASWCIDETMSTLRAALESLIRTRG